MQNNIKNISENKELFKAHIDSIFEDIEITINIEETVTDQNTKISNKNYNVVDLKVVPIRKSSDTTINEILDIVNEVNEGVLETNRSRERFYSGKRSGWSAFYVIKELIDRFEELYISKPEQLYFRGQIRNWQIEPSIYRDGENGFSSSFRSNFEEIYEDISKKYPEKISYFEPGNINRPKALAELQHYGLATPLVDITKNPFVALLFMIDGFDSTKLDDRENFNSPELDVFFIDKKKHTIFQDVPKDSKNPRIDAQRGAFLNFEKLQFFTGEGRIIRLRILFKINEEIQDTTAKNLQLAISKTSNIQNTFEALISDIKSKLASYRYLVSDLYPDFDKYLAFQSAKYRNKANRLNLFEKSSAIDYVKTASQDSLREINEIITNRLK